jgi:hypothetical protein
MKKAHLVNLVNLKKIKNSSNESWHITIFLWFIHNKIIASFQLKVHNEILGHTLGLFFISKSTLAFISKTWPICT